MKQEAATFLRIARTHLQNLRRVKPDWSKSKKQQEHAIVVFTMSAAAVEAAINQLLVLPTLAVEPRPLRMYFGQLLSEFNRTSIHNKIRFLERTFKKFKVSKPLRKSIIRLIDIRNDIMHSMPEYIEGAYTPEHESEWPGEPWDMENRPTTGYLYPEMYADPDEARELCQAAGDFVKILKNSGQGHLIGALNDFKKADNNRIEPRRKR